LPGHRRAHPVYTLICDEPTMADGQELSFRIVVGHGAAVLPGFQTARTLQLSAQGTELNVECVSAQGLRVKVRGVVIYKVADDFASIANAAGRFLGRQEQTAGMIHEMFAGHLRSIVGGLTIEEMLHSRERLTAEVRDSLSIDMQKLGLVVDSVQIQEIDDETGYVASVGRPHAAAVAAAARIAEAERDKEAAEAEQDALAEKAAYARDSQIRQAAAQAEIDAEVARAAQSGPLAQATAKQQVVEAETRTAQLNAALAERQLETQVRKPADAKAYATRVDAEAARDARVSSAEAAKRETELKAEADATRTTTAANADAAATQATAIAQSRATEARGLAEAKATEARGLAEATAVRARGEAEGSAIKARAEALADNQQAVIQQQVAERLPELVQAAAGAFNGVDNMVVLNGADGIEDMLAKVLTMGGAGYGLAKQLVNSLGSEPSEPAQDVEPVNSLVTTPTTGQMVVYRVPAPPKRP
ncbi:MAG: SPFH domain-containing protein, partial [Candidatus Nanopelagicales bacterium]